MADHPKIPSPPDIRMADLGLESLNSFEDLRPLASPLACEMAAWLQEAAMLVPVPPAGWPDERDAILCGLMVRVSKFLWRMAAACREPDPEAVEIFARCAFESIVNFHYLRDDNVGEGRLQQFKRSGYIPERMILDHLDDLELKKGRGGMDELELAAQTGLREFLQTNDLLEGPGAGKFKKRLGGSGLDQWMETYLWALPSRAVHGTYPNLVDVHLREVGEGVYGPKIEIGQVNPIIPLGAVYMALGVLDHYLFHVGEDLYQAWLPQLKKLEGRLSKIHQRSVEINDRENHQQNSGAE